LIESELFKRLKFTYDNCDYQVKIRKEVTKLQERFESYLVEYKIPRINNQGKLFFAKVKKGEDLQ
jgi:hypothetical protein